MNLSRSTYSGIVAVLIVLAVIVVWTIAQPVAAQGTPPKSDTGLTATPTPQPPTGDGRSANVSSRSVAQSDNGADARRTTANAPAVTFSYYRLLGTAFNERTTTTTYAYRLQWLHLRNGWN